MVTDDELRFLQYWKNRREKESMFSYQLFKGLPVGLLFALPVVLILFTSRLWYKRADMLANSALSPAILLIAVFSIATFVAIFYKRVQWEKKEQQYQELLRKKESDDPGPPDTSS